MQYNKEKVIRSFDRHKVVDQLTGCWLWTGATSTDGYGRIAQGKNNQRRNYNVSRLSLAIYKDLNYDDKSWLALHIKSCRHKNCFNPDHLYPGNHSSNLRDAYATGARK